MAIDDKLLKNFEDQIGVLKQMQDGLKQAIDAAQGQLLALKGGESIEKVFGASPKHSPAAQSRGGKDQR